MFKGGSIKEIMRRLISKFFIYESVPPQKVDAYHFKNMIFGAPQANLSNCIICFNNDIIILNYDCKFATNNSFPLIIYVGMSIEPPSPYEIKNKYLEMEYKDMKAYVNIQREE